MIRPTRRSLSCRTCSSARLGRDWLRCCLANDEGETPPADRSGDRERSGASRYEQSRASLVLFDRDANRSSKRRIAKSDSRQSVFFDAESWEVTCSADARHIPGALLPDDGIFSGTAYPNRLESIDLPRSDGTADWLVLRSEQPRLGRARRKQCGARRSAGTRFEPKLPAV